MKFSVLTQSQTFFLLDQNINRLLNFFKSFLAQSRSFSSNRVSFQLQFFFFPRKQVKYQWILKDNCCRSYFCIFNIFSSNLLIYLLFYMYDALQPQSMVNWREILNVLTAKTGKVFRIWAFYFRNLHLCYFGQRKVRLFVINCVCMHFYIAFCQGIHMTSFFTYSKIFWSVSVWTFRFPFHFREVR